VKIRLPDGEVCEGSQNVKRTDRKKRAWERCFGRPLANDEALRRSKCARTSRHRAPRRREMFVDMLDADEKRMMTKSVWLFAALLGKSRSSFHIKKYVGTPFTPSPTSNP